MAKVRFKTQGIRDHELILNSGSVLEYEKLFTYDNVGNRRTQVTTGIDAGSVAYTYDERDRLTDESGQPYSWDDSGNLISKDAEATYFWDYENRLTRVEKTDGTVVTHAYDADGNRVRTDNPAPADIWCTRGTCSAPSAVCATAGSTRPRRSASPY